MMMRRILCWVAAAAGLGFLAWAGFAGIVFAYSSRPLALVGPAGSASLRPAEAVLAQPLAAGDRIIQQFQPDEDGLTAVRVQAVTWGDRPCSGEVVWRLRTVGEDGRDGPVVRRGRIPCGDARDWQFIDLIFEPLRGVGTGTLRLEFLAPGVPADRCIGFPVHRDESRAGALKIVAASRAPTHDRLIDGEAHADACLRLEFYYHR